MLPRFWPHSALLVVYLHPFSLPPASRTQQLCVKLEPRGLLYVKLTLLEQWAAPTPRLSELPPPSVFAVELRHLVEKEACVPKVPLIIQKCVAEIEKRGLKVKFGRKKKKLNTHYFVGPPLALIMAHVCYGIVCFDNLMQSHVHFHPELFLISPRSCLGRPEPLC